MKGVETDDTLAGSKELAPFDSLQFKEESNNIESLTYKDVNTYMRFMFRAIKKERKCKFVFLGSLLLTILNGYLDIRLIQASGTLIDKIKSNDDGKMELLQTFVVMVLLHYFLTALTRITADYIEIIFSRTTLYNSISSTMEMNYFEFHRLGSGKITENIVNGSRALGEAASILLITIPEMIIFGIYCTFAMISFFNLKAGLFLIAGCIFGALFSFFIGLLINDGEEVRIGMFNNQLFRLNDILTNFDVVKSFNRAQKDISIYRNSLDECNWYEIKYSILKQSLAVLQRIGIYAPHVIMLYWIISQDNSLGFKISNIFLYNECFENYRDNFASIRDSAYIVIKAKSEGLWIIQNDFDFKEESKIPATFTKTISLKNCQLFAGKNCIQSSLNIEINQGELIAITGHNGSGKSTFLKALLRLSPLKGEFLVDEIPVDKLDSESYNDLISYVPQESNIFNDTVLNNLAYGQKKLDLEEIYHQCKIYGYYEFFQNLKDGFQTQCGEAGQFLSGGQRQRLNFMRGVLKGSPIIVLDEPSASLDKVSEVEMVDNLILLNKKGITVLIIVHNHDLLKRFDKILFFSKKGVTEYDSYEEFVLKDK